MIKKSFLLRLVLDGIAAGALLVAIAYYWLGNLTHELIGTGIFLLVLLHNLFNRRWWGSVRQAPREPRGWFDLSLTLTLLVAVAALLSTSVWISQSVFSFLTPPGGFTATRLHALAAHWVVILIAVHLGVRWKRVMHAARSLFGLNGASVIRTALLRLVALAIAGFGLQSSFAMDVGTKLAMQMSLEWWDFEASTAGFFVRWISILGLYIFLTHYMLAAVRALPGRFLGRAPTPKG